MGFYLQTPSNLDKAEQLRQLHGATDVKTPVKPSELKDTDLALICVVKNGFFDAAAFCYNDSEYEAFNEPDGRRKDWLLLPKEIVYKEANFDPVKMSHLLP